MSCRKPAGGKAASAAATAVTGISADDVPEVMHRLRREFREAGHTEQATPEQVVSAMQALGVHVRNRTGISEGRREQAIRRIEAAIQSARAGDEPLPDVATVKTWRYLIPQIDADRVGAAILQRRAERLATETQETPTPTPEQTAGEHPEERASTPNTSPRSPRPYHKRFTNFHAQTITATKELFAARPSQLTPEQRHEVFTQWISDVSAVYDMEPPELIWDEEADYGGGGFYNTVDHTITMSPNHPSVTTLIHETRHAMQTTRKGAPMVSADVEEDARAWSLSLYAKVKPRLFDRLVREGRILHITPAELD